MSETVERLREASRYDMKLENGVSIKYVLPYMQDLVLARLLPITILDDIKAELAKGTDEKDVTDKVEQSIEERVADYAAEFAAKKRVVAGMIRWVDGEDATVSPDEVTDVIPPENFTRLVRVALRAEPPGGAEGEA